jgi:hypothetical protein
MLRIIQRFGILCCCHLQGEYEKVGRFWKPYIGEVAGGELDLMMLIGGAEAHWLLFQLIQSDLHLSLFSKNHLNIILTYTRLTTLSLHTMLSNQTLLISSLSVCATSSANLIFVHLIPLG